MQLPQTRSLLNHSTGQSLRRNRQGTLPTRRLLPRYVPLPSPAHQHQKLTYKRTVFTGKDASRALALTSTKAEDVRPDWQDLDEKEKKTLDDWMTYFSKRYNIVGVVAGAAEEE
jgi:hypothetical protein